MPTFGGEVQTRTEDATACHDLASFCCGNGHLEAERAVQRIVESCYAGGWPRSTLRVTRDSSSSALVGVCLIAPQPPPITHPKLTAHAYCASPYIAVIGLCESYRRLGLGDHLIHDALRHISRTRSGGMPYVLAMIAPDNEPSLRLFRRHGFELLIEMQDHLYRRPKNLKVPR